MSNPLISIIIPLYNTPLNFLDRCVESIKSQTYNNIEIIIVNDGSTVDYDAYFIGLKESLDKKFIIEEKQNGGVSSARNKGLDIASGDYIMFVDPDDELASNCCIDNSVKLANKYSADIVFGRVSYRFANCDCDTSFGLGSKKISLFESKKQISELVDYFFSYATKRGSHVPDSLNRGPVAKIVKSSLLRNIAFDEKLIFAEDAIFNSELAARATRVVFDDEVWYYYYQYTKSLSHTENIPMWKDVCAEALVHVINPELMPAYWSFCRHGIISACINELRSKKATAYPSIKKFISSDWAQEVISKFNEDEYVIPKWESVLVGMMQKKHYVSFCIIGALGCLYMRFNGKKLIEV